MRSQTGVWERETFYFVFAGINKCPRPPKNSKAEHIGILDGLSRPNRLLPSRFSQAILPEYEAWHVPHQV